MLFNYAHSYYFMFALVFSVDVLLSALLAAQKKNNRQPQAPLLSTWIVATKNYIRSNLKAIKKPQINKYLLY